MTQKQVAEATGRDQTTISAWMKGENWPALAALPVIDELCGKRRGFILESAGFVNRGVDVEAAIRRDRALDEDSKAAMLLSYRTFVKLSEPSHTV